MVNFSEMGESALYTAHVSSGVEYSLSFDTPELSTPSSTPPVMPISISRIMFMGANLLRYLAQMAMFSSSGSSERSSMCEEKRGSPWALKYFSLASIMPSNHLSHALQQ